MGNFDDNTPQLFQEYFDEKIDIQIKTREHIDKQAGRLLSIWLTFIGIFITVGLAVGSGRISPPIQTTGPDTISSELELLNILLGDGAAEIIFVAVFVIGALAAISTIVALFIWAPYQALSVLKTDTPKHWLSITDHQLMDRKTVDASQIQSRQKDQIRQNNQYLNHAKDAWESCLAAIQYGLVSLGFFLLAFFTLFIVRNSALLLLSFIIFMLGVGKYMAENRTYLQERLYGGTIEHTLMFFLLFSFIGMIAIEAVYFLNQALYAFYLLPILYYSVNLPEDITVTELGKYILANVGYSFSWQQFGLPISGFCGNTKYLSVKLPH